MNRLEKLKIIRTISLILCIIIALSIVICISIVKYYESQDILEKELKYMNEIEKKDNFFVFSKEYKYNKTADKIKVNLKFKRDIAVPFEKKNKLLKLSKRRRFPRNLKLVLDKDDQNIKANCSKNYNLYLNKKCYKLINKNIVMENKVCEPYNLSLFQLKTKEDIFLLKNISLNIENNTHIDVGVKCEQIKNCTNVIMNEIYHKKINISSIIEPCSIVFNIITKEFECFNDTKKSQLSYLCEDNNTTNTLLPCKNTDNMRDTDGYCYNKENILNTYSKKVAKQICMDMKMSLPNLEDTNRLNVGQKRAKEMNTNIWVDAECIYETTIKCKWSETKDIDSKIFLPEALKKRKSDEKCVALDKASGSLLFVKCDSHLGVFCQTKE
uniref:C-type lectin domain-containing protein n=1 Tax=Parastrongyloides trichosuri TaxID=131310 RepID=A0A0N4ZA24_PARTI